MSSAPQYPSNTPLQSSMAANEENLEPRTPLPNETTEVVSKENMLPSDGAPKQKGREEIQVYATQPSNNVISIQKPDEEVAQVQVADENLKVTEDAAAEEDLPEFDWSDLEKRYTEAIQKVDSEEDQILEEFDRAVDVILWSFLTMVKC